MKGPRVANKVKEIEFEEVWGESESKKMFLGTITHKISEIKSSFHVKTRLGLVFT